MGKIDHDAVLRARVLLLGSGRLSLLEQVHAYRVLAEVSPKAYLPKLVDVLLSMSYRSRNPEVDLALGAEAVEAARKIAGAAARAERLCRALDVYQAALFALGRRAEGLAACEEMAAAGRDGRLASILAEEGRFREAAELNEKAARNGVLEHSSWNMVEWAPACTTRQWPSSASSLTRPGARPPSGARRWPSSPGSWCTSPGCARPPGAGWTPRPLGGRP